MRAQLVAKRWQQLDRPDSGIGLGTSDAQAPRREVDVAPPEFERFTDAQASERESGEQRAPRGRASILARFVVELARRAQQGRDLFGAIEVGALRPTLLELAPTRVDPDRVSVNKLALGSKVEDLAQARDRLVDRGRRELPGADLRLAIAIDLRDGDLGESVIFEERQQVI